MYTSAGVIKTMTYDHAFFDQGIDRKGTKSVKWEARDLMTADTLPLWVADMDFPAPRPSATR